MQEVAQWIVPPDWIATYLPKKKDPSLLRQIQGACKVIEPHTWDAFRNVVRIRFGDVGCIGRK
jgi:hypothetical protein